MRATIHYHLLLYSDHIYSCNLSNINQIRVTYCISGCGPLPCLICPLTSHQHNLLHSLHIHCSSECTLNANVCKLMRAQKSPLHACTPTEAHTHIFTHTFTLYIPSVLAALFLSATLPYGACYHFPYRLRLCKSNKYIAPQ